MWYNARAGTLSSKYKIKMSRAQWIRDLAAQGLSEEEIVRKIMGDKLPEGVKPFTGGEIMAKLVVRKQLHPKKK